MLTLALLLCVRTPLPAALWCSQTMDPSIPEPSTDELADPSSKYCSNVTAGNSFISAERRQIQVRMQSKRVDAQGNDTRADPL